MATPAVAVRSIHFRFYSHRDKSLPRKLDSTPRQVHLPHLHQPNVDLGGHFRAANTQERPRCFEKPTNFRNGASSESDRLKKKVLRLRVQFGTRDCMHHTSFCQKIRWAEQDDSFTNSVSPDGSLIPTQPSPSACEFLPYSA